MRHVNENTVQLTPYEDDAKKHFEFLLDEGHTIEQAHLDTMREYPNLSPKFCGWMLTGKSGW